MYVSKHFHVQADRHDEDNNCSKRFYSPDKNENVLAISEETFRLDNRNKKWWHPFVIVRRLQIKYDE